MTLTVTAGELQTVVSAINDATAALSADLTNLAADQAVILDAVNILALFDPALAPLIVLEPLAAAIVAYVLSQNTQGEPGSQVPMRGSGAKGSSGSGGGAIP